MKYLYAMIDTVLEIWRGELDQCSDLAQTTKFKRLMTPGSKLGRSVAVSTHPGVIHNGYLWLEDRDDQHAIELFLEYETDILNQKKAEMQLHRDRVAYLQHRKGRIV